MCILCASGFSSLHTLVDIYQAHKTEGKPYLQMEESDMNEVEGGSVEEDEIEDEEEIDDKNLYTRLDATSSNSCKRMWNQIKANHNDISSLIISHNAFQNGLFDWGNEAGCIGLNTNVKKMVLVGVGWGYDEEIRQQNHFLRGLGENR